VAAELDEEFPGAEVSLIKGSAGVFEVTVDGVLVFSKRKVGRHAQPGEVVAALRATHE
jgi:selT/selW/selH-like putative selenoprotein